MSLDDLLNAVSKYGAIPVIIAVLALALVFIYKQQTDSLKAAKSEAQARADRLESELKALNAELQRYLLTGYMVRQVMDEAVTEMSRHAPVATQPESRLRQLPGEGGRLCGDDHQDLRGASDQGG